jgi:circadian clock protein KaiC
MEEHLLVSHRCISDFKPDIVVVDPVTNLLSVSTHHEVRSMLTRLVDYLKTQGITSVFTSLTGGGELLDASESDVSTLMDTCIRLKSVVVEGERNRAISVLKSRGMEHSNQIREFLITGEGLRLLDVYLGPDGVLTGSARVSQEGRERAADTSRASELAGRRRDLARKRRMFDARMVMLKTEFEEEEESIQQGISASTKVREELLRERGQMGRSRKADTSAYQKEGRGKPSRKH